MAFTTAPLETRRSMRDACPTEQKDFTKEKDKRLSGPKCEATTLLYPLVPWHEPGQEELFCLRGTRANIKSDSADSGHFGVPLNGDLAPIYFLAREGSGKEP